MSIDITDHLRRIEEKLDYIIETNRLQEINDRIQENPDQMCFTWYKNSTNITESGVVK